MLSAQLVGRLLPEIQHSDNIRWDIDKAKDKKDNNKGKDKQLFCDIQTVKDKIEQSLVKTSGQDIIYYPKVKSFWN